MKKQAARIASKAIELAREESKLTVAESGAPIAGILNRLQESHRVREIEGKDALTNLRRLGGKKLVRGEEIIIARHLYDELPALKRQLRARGVGIGLFCTRAKITDASDSSKELHRLTLPPGKNPESVRLRRTAAKYRQLLEAISKATNESASTLADRVLQGTSLHPSQMDNLSETEMVQTALQRIVDKVDDEYGLYGKFMDIAELKVKQVAAGGTEYWPLCQEPSDTLFPEEYDHLADATDKRFAFWKRPIEYGVVDANGAPAPFFEQTIDLTDYFPPWPMAMESGVQQDTEFFYVPHVPLGVIIDFDLPRRKDSSALYEKAVQLNLDRWRMIDPSTGKSWLSLEYTVKDEWDSEAQRPIGQIINEPTRAYGTRFAWLVIYPMPDSSRLKPMLYISSEESGAYLLPIDARTLDIYRDAVWVSETEHMSVFDRIKELLGYRAGVQKVIEEGFRKTAPWLDHNPIFKIRRKDKEDLQMLDMFCHQLWEEK